MRKGTGNVSRSATFVEHDRQSISGMEGSWKFLEYIVGQYDASQCWVRWEDLYSGVVIMRCKGPCQSYSYLTHKAEQAKSGADQPKPTMASAAHSRGFVGSPLSLQDFNPLSCPFPPLLSFLPRPNSSCSSTNLNLCPKMAHFLRGKQAGIQKDFSDGLSADLFALDDVRRRHPHFVNSAANALAVCPVWREFPD